jgi:deazaflavin-dependent oxidoreductase (nitroreductase family)
MSNGIYRSMPQHSEKFLQRQSGVFVYPRTLWRKAVWRLPLFLWRTGFAPVFSLAPMVVMTTRGRKTGQPRTVMTDCLMIGDRTYVVPGWGDRTQWYQNLEADPNLTVQKSGQTYAATVHRVADPEELTEIFQHVPRANPMWKRFLRSWDVEDDLEDFLAKRERFVVLRLERNPRQLPLPPLRMDLFWVWPTVAAGAFVLWRCTHRARGI